MAILNDRVLFPHVTRRIIFDDESLLNRVVRPMRFEYQHKYCYSAKENTNECLIIIERFRVRVALNDSMRLLYMTFYTAVFTFPNSNETKLLVTHIVSRVIPNIIRFFGHDSIIFLVFR